MEIEFVESQSDIINSIIEFNRDPLLIREALGNHPKYFVCLIKNGELQFGLSKFCSFKNMDIAEYNGIGRYKTDGGVAQKRLKKICNQEWLSISKVNSVTRTHFKSWCNTYFPNYDVNNASFIEIKQSIANKPKRKVAQDEIDKALLIKKEIGEIGEKIALEFEHSRLKEVGCNNPKQYVKHIAKEYANAGYDIFSDYKKEVRFIEVKSTTTNNNEFYLTANELEVLKNNPDKSYIYVVRISNLKSKKGSVVRTIKSPISQIITAKPILFKVKFK